MNATNQQLFMVPDFRRAILAIPDTDRSSTGVDERSHSTVVAYQMQRLFAYVHFLFYIECMTEYFNILM